jgi:hypothetical protein
MGKGARPTQFYLVLERGYRRARRDCSDSKLVERQRVAHGVSHGKVATSTQPRHGAKERSAGIFRDSLDRAIFR